MSASLLFVPTSPVQGAGPLGFSILQVIERGGYSPITSANVSQEITVYAVLYTSSGQYNVYFNDVLVDSNVASGYYVASNFTIPEVPAGNYTITLTDVTIATNTTYEFVVDTAYLVQPVLPLAPAQLQEGNDVTLNVSVTGGKPNTAYTANITVIPPASLNITYYQLVSLTTSASGTANAKITFPSSSFSPSGSNTIYSGTYNAVFNSSQGLGFSTFIVGFTDKTQYHRQDTVTINAVGYQSGQSTTVTITNGNGETVSSQSITASPQGIIHTSWKIPSSAAVGTYNVTITPQNNPKTILDTQTFQIPGYPITFYTLNLAGEPVDNILVEARDQATNQLYNSTSYYGVSIINLEAGNYAVDVYWNQVNVGELSISPTGNSSFNITCRLTNLQVLVQDKNGYVIPYADLVLNYQYLNRTGSIQTGTASGQTSLAGVYYFNSTLPEADYTISASKYNSVFNSNNNTFSDLPQQPITKVTIICPEKTLTLRTIDSNSAVLSNLRVELIEQSSGISYSGLTNSIGVLELPVTLGQYQVKVYTTDNILLNETTIKVLDVTESQIVCGLYNLRITVKIVDYFGAPVPNVNVKIGSSGMAERLATTQSDGTATFENAVGGDLIITAYISGNENSYIAKNIKVDSPTIVQMSMANYVLIGGLLIGTSMLATLIIVLLAIIVLAVILIYRRRRHKTK